MEKILILSFLGKGRYNKSLYYRIETEREFKISYLSPLANAYFELDKNKDIEIIFFITKEVEEDFLNNISNEFGRRIKEEIMNAKKMGINISFENIPTGKNYDELENIMILIENTITNFKGDKVIFDLTHGLRHVSTFSTGVIFYLRNIYKNFEDKNILLYYGAYEVGEEINNFERKVPILNISPTLEISNLTLALEEFEKYGITIRVENALKNIQKLVAINKLCDANKLRFSPLAKELSNLNDVIRLPSSPEKIINTIFKIREILGSSLEEFEKCSNSTQKYFFINPIKKFLLSLEKLIVENMFNGISILENIEDLSKKVLTKEKIIFMAKFIKILIKWEMYSEAIIQIRETLIDMQLFAKNKIEYYNDKNYREKIFKEKFISNEKIFERLEKLTNNVIDTRNKIAHAGRASDNFTKENLKKYLSSYIEEILDIVDMFDVKNNFKVEEPKKKKIYLLNSIIIPIEKNDLKGKFTIEKIDENKFKTILEKSLNQKILDSAIGHESISHFIKDKFGLDIPVERKEVYFEKYDEALVIKLEKRPEEGKIYTFDEMKYMEENNLIGYYYIYRDE
jgi:hypothetical protein